MGKKKKTSRKVIYNRVNQDHTVSQSIMLTPVLHAELIQRKKKNQRPNLRRNTALLRIDLEGRLLDRSRQGRRHRCCHPTMSGLLVDLHQSVQVA